MTFEGFDRIRIINLPSRSDRRRAMMGELRRMGLEDDPRVQFVEGIQTDDHRPFRTRGERGVFLAHLKILKDAAEASESVLILEDDVDFTAGAERWHREAGCDIAYGGYVASDPSHPEESDIIGAHCMGFSSRAAKALSVYLERLLSHESPPPIDGAYVWFRRNHPEFTSQFAHPVIAVQRPSRSDIAEVRAFDRIRILRGVVAAARGVKRKLRRRELTFGLTESIVISLLGIAIAAMAAYHYVHESAARP